MAILKSPSSKGYEFSVYSAYPWYFWILLIANFAIIMFLLLYSKNTPDIISLLTIMAVFILYIIFLGIPYWRYPLWGRGDDFLTHLGYIKGIELNKFFISNEDIYPAIHIYGLSIKEIANISLIHTGYIMFMSFSIFVYLGGTLLLTVLFSYENNSRLIGLIFGMPFLFSVFHVNTHPSIISAWYTFFIIYFYFQYLKTSKIEHMISLGLIMFFFTFLHPIILIFLTIWFVLPYSFARVLNEKNHGVNLTIAIIPAILFSLWYLRFYSIQYYLRLIFQILQQEYYVPSRAELYTSIAKTAINAGLTLPQLLRALLLRHGSVGVSFVITIVVIIKVLGEIITRHKYSPRRDAKHEFTVIFPIIFFLFSIIWGTFMFLGYFVELKPIRLFRFAIIASIIVNVWGLYYLDKKTQSNYMNVARRLVAIMLLIMIVLSILGTYPSPLEYSANLHTTQMELSSIGFLLKLKNKETKITGNSPLFIIRIADYVKGTSYKNRVQVGINPKRLPSHFGFPSNYSDVLNTPQYIYLSKFDLEYPFKVLPENVRDAAHQYTEEDIALLLSQDNAFVVYKNSEVMVFLVNERQNAER